MWASLIAAARLVHPAPTAAVTLLSAVLGAVLLAQADRPLDARWLLSVAAVLGSQVFTGATNDIVDRERDATLRPSKPLVDGSLSLNAAIWVASAGLALQLAASWQLGILPLLLGALASGLALVYNLFLSRTPYSALPYLASFGILPAWIALSLGLPLERVLPAIPLVAPFAVAAHLANTLRDFDADAALGARNLAQVLGRTASRWLAIGLALAVGLGAGAALAIGGGLTLPSIGLGVIGLAAVSAGARGERALWVGILVASVTWTAAWALATG